MKPFTVRFTYSGWEDLVQCLAARTDVETKAFVSCSCIEGVSKDILLVRDLLPVPPSAYAERSKTTVVVRPEFVHDLLTCCVREDLGLIEIHTHPQSENVRFSSVDLDSDPRKFEATRKIGGAFRHASLVFGKDLSVDGHLAGRTAGEMQVLDRVVVLGEHFRHTFRTGSQGEIPVDEGRFERQIDLFGRRGQELLSGVHIGVVGCGGLGSQVVQALTLLGVRHFTLVDPDTLELSNGNRVVGVLPEDVEARLPKVQALSQSIKRLCGHDAQVVTVQESVEHPAAWRQLAECDLLIGVVDSPLARVLLSQISTSCLVPYFDAGVGLKALGGQFEAGGGQVHVTIPGLTPCRTCLGLNIGASEETLTLGQQEDRARAGYIEGANVANPQVVFLNGIVGNALVWEVVKYVTGVGTLRPYTYFDLTTSEMYQPIIGERCADCISCSENGWLASGIAATELATESAA